MLRRVGISLLADERPVSGGTATTTWLYFDAQRWRSVRDYPGATFSRQDCGPGLSWQTRADLEVEPFTWIQRVDRTPNRERQPTDPLEYLRREIVKSRYAVRRTFFQVATNGKLLKRPRQDAPLDDEALG